MKKTVLSLFVVSLFVVFMGITTSVHAIQKVSVFAGNTDRDTCPVMVEITDDINLPPIKQFMLVSEDETTPAAVIQSGDKDYLVFIVNNLNAFEKRTYMIEEGEITNNHMVSISQEDQKMEISIGGQKFTDFLFEREKQPRPIFYPIIGPNGARMTRGYPMDPKPNERQDHPHHQSLWVSHGDVNGENFWHLDDPEEQDKQVIQEINRVESNPVVGVIDADIDWVNEDGERIVSERRIMRIWGTPEDQRFIDFELHLTAEDGDVSFNDTKEGGLISLRIATSMDESQRDKSQKGGTITNANGLVNESKAWGKPARWCDYSGTVDGITAGFTIMDHPSNLFYPTRYHVRGYGLFTANPFGLSHFIGDNHNGTQVLKDGETWHLNYRVYIHAGDVEGGNVAQTYVNYADGPKVFFDSAAEMDD